MKHLPFLIIALTLLIGLDYVGAWNVPGTNPPAGQVAAPLHTGVPAQSKAGLLGVLDLVSQQQVSAGDKMRSPEYCDETGLVCFTAEDIQDIKDSLSRINTTNNNTTNNNTTNNNNQQTYKKCQQESFGGTWLAKAKHGVTTRATCGNYPHTLPCYITGIQTPGTYSCNNGNWYEVSAPVRIGR